MSENNNINNDEEENFEEFKKPEGFDVPEDYFSSFSSRLFKKLDSENELSEFKILASIPKQQPFSVPENYFSSLERKTELSAYPGLAAVKAVYPFEVGEAYFENLPLLLKNKIAIAEEIKEYTLLSSIQKTNPFELEESYFDSLTSKIQDKIFAPTAHGPSIVDRLFELFFARKTAYAFSAVLVVGLLIAYFNRTEVVNTAPCNTMACLEKHEIMNSNEIKSMDEETIIDMINIEALSDSLHKHQTKGLKNQKVDYIIDNVDTDNLMDEF